MAFHGFQVAAYPGSAETFQSASATYNESQMTYDPFPEDGRILGAGWWGGVTSSPYVIAASYFSIRDAASGDLLARSVNQSVGVVFGPGARYQPAIEAVRPNAGRGRTNRAMLARRGELLSYGMTRSSGDIYLPTVAGQIGQSGTTRFTSSSYPYAFTQPFVTTAMTKRLGGNGKVPLWTYYVANRPPDAPTIIAPANAAIVSSANPTITADFTDADRTAGYGEHPTRLTVALYDVTDPLAPAFHGTRHYVAGPDFPLAPVGTADTAAVRVSVPWDGPALVFGKTYALGLRWEDEYGTTGRSAWAGIVPPAGTESGTGVALVSWSRTFALPNAGNVASTSPVGKQETLAGLVFAGTYTHASGLAAATARLRLLRRGAAGAYEPVAPDGPLFDLVPDVAAGGTIALTQAQAALPALEWGTDYAAEWRIVDTNGLDGGWTGRTAFATNRAPSTPTNRAPPTGSGAPTRPSVSFDLADDDDTAETGLVGRVEITGPIGTTATFDVDAAGWTAQANGAGVTATQGRATDQVDAGAGSYAQRVTASTLASGAVATTTWEATVPCVAGRSYAARARVRRSATGLRPRVGLRFLDGTGASLSAAFSTADPAINVWADASVTVVAPVGAVSMRRVLDAVSTAANATGTVWFDTVLFDPGVRAVRDAAPVVGTTTRWTYQTTTADLPDYGLYRFAVFGFDGTLTGAMSAPATFVYAVGPQPAISDPLDGGTVATATPTVTWTVPTGTQNRYRVRWIPTVGTAAGYDSGWVVDPAIRAVSVPTTRPLPAGVYALTVDLEDPGGLTGSATRSVTIAFPGPDPITGLAASAEMLRFDRPNHPSALTLSWNPVDTPTASLDAVEVAIRPAGSATEPNVIVRFVGAAASYATTYLYPFPPSGREMSYLVRQVTKQGTVLTPGPWTAIDVTVTFTATVVCSVVDPVGQRVVFESLARRGLTGDREQELGRPAGARYPVAATGRYRGLSVAFEATIYAPPVGVAPVREIEDAWLALDEEGGTVCYRDSKGRVVFGVVETGWSWSDTPRSKKSTLSFGVARTGYEEGLSS